MITLEMVLQAILNGVLLGGIYAVIATGKNLMFGVMKILNFAHGDMVILGAYATFWFLVLYGVDPYLSIVGVAAIFLTLGVAVQRLLFDRVVQAPMSASLLISFGLGYVLRESVRAVWGSDFRGIVTSYSTVSIKLLGGIFLSVPRTVAFAISLAMSAVLYIILKKTYLGKAIRATADDMNSAMVTGINVGGIYLITTGIATATAAVAGSQIGILYTFYPEAGYTFVIKAFVICVLGGLGNLLGSFFGGLMLGVIESITMVLIPAAFMDIITYGILIFVLLFKPKGLFGG